MEAADAVEKASASLKELKAGRSSGLLCRSCRKRRPWAKLKVEYYEKDGKFFRIWFCDCGRQIKEEEIK